MLSPNARPCCQRPWSQKTSREEERWGAEFGSRGARLRLGYAEFFWVSSPEATHSRNIAVRPQVGFAIFNSQVPIGTGQGVYTRAEAEEVTGAEVAHGIEVFSRRSLAHGGVAWTAEDVEGASGVRLYRARAAEHSILAKDGEPDHRIPTDPEP